MATPGFELLFQNLENIGFFEFVLPLVLFMAIYFGLLRQMELLGEDEAVQGAASVALAFLTTFGIYTVIPFSFFPQFFGVLSIIIVVILGVMILMGLVGFRISDEIEGRTQRLGLVGVILIVLVLFPAMFTGLGFDFQITEQHSTFLLTLVLIAVLAYVLRGFSD